MVRITTNGVLRSYKSSLMRSNNNLNSARNKVLTQRNFNSFAEDPAAATQAFQLRRSFSRVSDQIDNSKTVVNKFDSAWDSVDKVKDLVEEAVKEAAMRGENGPTGSGREPISKVLRSKAESIVQSMNAKYGESFMFAGSNGLTVPFELKDGKLLYRGLDVDDPANKAKLDELAAETNYVDLGMGLQEDANGKLISTSGFNSAISGADILGYGVDADGDPKNAVSLILKMADVFERSDPDTGDLSAADEELVTKLSGKLEGSLNELTKKYVELDGRSEFLDVNLKRLVSTADNLNEQILSIEQVDMADAISEFSWAQYTYNAALKVGNSILSQSLIDYMN